MAVNYPSYQNNQQMIPTMQMPNTYQQPQQPVQNFQQPMQTPIQQAPMQPQPNPQQSQQYFPQPQGNIFMINASQDIANVPVGNDVSAAVCLSEGTMYLKTMQNGKPMLLGYKLSPLGEQTSSSIFEEATTVKTEGIENEKLQKLLGEYGTKITNLESQIGKIKEKIGGQIEWPL